MPVCQSSGWCSPELGMVAGQFLGWSPASSWLGHPAWGANFLSSPGVGMLQCRVGAGHCGVCRYSDTLKNKAKSIYLHCSSVNTLSKPKGRYATHDPRLNCEHTVRRVTVTNLDRGCSQTEHGRERFELQLAELQDRGRSMWLHGLLESHHSSGLPLSVTRTGMPTGVDARCTG